LKLGVLALQGDFYEHRLILDKLGVGSVEVRLPPELDGLDGLIVPGGESTTIGKLAREFDLIEPLRSFGKNLPIWGTCAGAIFLSKDAQRDQPLLGLMDISVERNAFGRQIASFEADLDVPVLLEPERPYPAVFIRAPLIERVGEAVDVIARVEGDSARAPGRIVAAREGHFLATSFHPELTQDTRFHQYFLDIVSGR
jgi:5'-phosphate synthase pdxT subunit